MGVIYFVRHAQAQALAYGVQTGEPQAGGLTELGEEQAQLTGHALALRIPRFDAAMCGTLLRQEQTMEAILAAVPAAEVTSDPRWNEYDIDALLGGTGEAATAPDPRALQSRVDDALIRWVSGDDPSGGASESYDGFRARVAAATAIAAERAGRGRTVLVVASSGVITQALADIWSAPGRSWVEMSRTMVNASISKVMVGNRGSSVLSMNEHAHLEKHGIGPSGQPTFR